MVWILFGTTVFIVGLKKCDNGCSCVNHTVCGSTLTKAMEVCLWHSIVCIDGGKEEPAIAAHAVVDGIETCLVGFLLKEVADRDSIKKIWWTSCCCVGCFLSRQGQDYQSFPQAFGSRKLWVCSSINNHTRFFEEASKWRTWISQT